MNVFFDISSGEILKTISGTLTWQQKQVYLDETSGILVIADDTNTQYKKVNMNNDEFTLITDEGLVRKARNKLLFETKSIISFFNKFGSIDEILNLSILLVKSNSLISSRNVVSCFLLPNSPFP